MSGAIRYRAWSVRDKTWVSVCVDAEGYPWASEAGRPTGKPLNSDRLIVEQWTGLTDKAGRDIYEGDFVVTSNDGKDGADQWDADDYGPALVTMDTQGVHMCEQGHLKEPGYCWSWDDEDSVHHTRYLKVVGNIHESHAA